MSQTITYYDHERRMPNQRDDQPCTVSRRCTWFFAEARIRLILRVNSKCHRQISNNLTLPNCMSIATRHHSLWFLTSTQHSTRIQLRSSSHSHRSSFFRPSFVTVTDHGDTSQCQASPHPRSAQLSPSLVGALTSDQLPSIWYINHDFLDGSVLSVAKYELGTRRL